MRRLALVFIVAFAFSATAMAGDIALSTHAGWFDQAAADREMQEIADNVTAVPVEQFTADQQDALADWVVAHTGNGVADLLILCGQFPATIYPGSNGEPDGSIAELFLDDGNIIVNTGDYLFYVSPGGNNGTGGLENMMDIAGISMWDDNTPVVVTADGLAITPTLVDFLTDRPFHLDQLEGGWYPELVLAQNAAGTRADAVIVANTPTGGRLGIFYQTAGQADDPRGEVMSEWINNWYITAGPVPNLVSGPNPADGAVDADVASLGWTPGHASVSDKVYLSTDSTIDDADLAGETDLALQIVTLDPGAAYYWRVDGVDADGNVTEGPVWSFSTLPIEAHFPAPADGATNASSVELSWTPGKGAIMHNVHYGTDPAALLPVQMMSMETSYDPGPLDPDTTYYWRVDEFAGAVTNPGPVWSFSTIGDVAPSGMADLIAQFEFDEDASTLSALDTSGNNHHGPLLGDASIAGGILSVDGNGDAVDAGSDASFHPAGAFSVAAYVKMTSWGGGWGNAIAGTRGESGLGWQLRRHSGNQNLTFTVRGTPGADDPRGTISPPLNEWIYVAAVFDPDGGTRSVYINGDLDVQIEDSGAVAVSDHNMFIGARSSGGGGPEAFFNGDIDYVHVYNRALTVEDVRTLAGVAELSYAPAPADGEVDLPDRGVSLSWSPAIGAVEQDVYLSSDAAAVVDADATDATGVYVGRQAETELALGDLGRGVTYFWRVDGVTADGTVMPGLVWSFRVLDRHTANWASNVGSVADYVNTYVQRGAYDIGALSGDITYEFIVNSNPDEEEASMALIGRHGHGDTTVALKYEQWNNTGTYGATVFGVADHDYGVATAPGEYTHLVFVSSEDAATTELYVNGELAGSVSTAITLSGIVGIGQAIRDPEGIGVVDPFDGDIFGVAIYDRALTAEEIAGNAEKYFSPIPITDPDMLIYYDFESGEGATAIDQSGHGNHGQFMGNPEWATGLFGGAVSIDIADLDYVQTDAPLGIVSNTVSISGWVKHDELPAAWSGILTHRGTSPGNVGLQHNGSELRYMWGPDLYWYFESGLALPVGEWYFAALTISPDQGKLYLNGIEQTATNVDVHEPTNFDSLVRVGRDHSDDRIMTSLIDEVRFYNKTLTDVEVLKLAKPQLADVTAPGDTVVSLPIYNSPSNGNEDPPMGIDDDVTTKYLNFEGATQSTGIAIEPAMGPTVVTALTLTTANDSPERDPASFEISGSNVSLDGPYEVIASGDVVDFTQADPLPRFTTNATAITFENTVAYKYYQVMFPTTRGPGQNSMQIAEVELLGVPGPVGHWTFDDGAGIVALDTSGSGNDGTLEGDPQWVVGMVGGALDFDGDGDFVSTGKSASDLGIGGNNPRTVTAWVFTIGFNNGGIFDVGNCATGQDFCLRTLGTDNQWRIQYWGGDFDFTLDSKDKWVHFALVHDGERTKVYADGVLIVDWAKTINTPDTNPFQIGAYGWQNDFFDGTIDDVQVYQQALSAGQIAEIAKP